MIDLNYVETIQEDTSAILSKNLIVIKISLKHIAFAPFYTSRMCEIIHPSKHLETDHLFVERILSHPKSNDLFSMRYARFHFIQKHFTVKFQTYARNIKHIGQDFRIAKNERDHITAL